MVGIELAETREGFTKWNRKQISLVLQRRQTCIYCGCVILARELTNNVTDSALEKLQKDGGIAQQWSKVQPGGKWRTFTFLVRRKTIPRRD